MKDRGSVSVLVVAGLGLLVLVGLTIPTAGHYLSARAHAQNAADAAALAAAPVTFRPLGSAGDPGVEAARLALANGVRLVRCSCPVDRSWNARTVEVEVVHEVDVIVIGRREVRAVAAAEFAPTRLIADVRWTTNGYDTDDDTDPNSVR